MKPRFTLPNLFWLILVCAGTCAWGLDHWRTSQRVAEVEIQLAQAAANGVAPRKARKPRRWATTWDPYGSYETRRFLAWSFDRHSEFASMQLNADGDCVDLGIYPCCGLTDEDVMEIAKLKTLHSLSCFGAPLTDRALEMFSTMPQLRVLHVAAAKGVSDEAIARLRTARPDMEIEMSYRN